jgi:hypothetical protein
LPPKHLRHSDEEIGDMILDRLKLGEARLVTELATALRVPQYRIRDAAEEHEKLDLLVGLGVGGSVWRLPQQDYRVERVA